MRKDHQFVDTAKTFSNKYRAYDRNMIPGFTTSSKTRPLIIEKMSQFVREGSVKINSIRLIEELFVFIFNNGKPEALSGYNDDLVMSLSISIWIRETALRLHKENLELTRQTVSQIDRNDGVYKFESDEDYGWGMKIKDQKEDLTWLI